MKEFKSSGMSMKKDESVWLIDDGKLCVGFCGKAWKWVTYTDPKALKFETADLANTFIKKNGIEGATAIEHMFCTAKGAER